MFSDRGLYEGAFSAKAVTQRCIPTPAMPSMNSSVGEATCTIRTLNPGGSLPSRAHHHMEGCCPAPEGWTEGRNEKYMQWTTVVQI